MGTIDAMNGKALNFEMDAASAQTLTPLSRLKVARPATIQATVALVLLTFAFLTRFAWYNDPITDYDEQLYSLIGKRMLHGDLPFVDLWDRKPFGLFCLFALAHLIGGPDPISYQVLATLFAFAGAWLLYFLASRITDGVTACVIGVIYLCMMTRYGSHSGQTEIFLAPLMLGMVALIRGCNAENLDRRLSLVMLIGGIALQIKYTVLPQCFFVGAFAIYRSFKLGVTATLLMARTLKYALIGLLPTLLVGAYYGWVGEFESFYFSNFESFFLREPAGVGRFNPAFQQFLAPLAVLILVGLYFRWRGNPFRMTKSADYNLYVGWMLSCVATIYLPSTVYFYYFASLIPAALLVGIPLLDRRGPMSALPLALMTIASVAMVGLSVWFGDPAAERKNVEAFATKISPFVMTSGETECLLVFDGPTALYQMTKSCLPSKFIYADHLNNALEHRALGVSQTVEVERILRNSPGVIVTADNPVTPQNIGANNAVQRAIATNYRHHADMMWGTRKVSAWIRTDD